MTGNASELGEGVTELRAYWMHRFSNPYSARPFGAVSENPCISTDRKRRSQRAPMGQPIVDRRLAAILAADVVGYSRPMQLDEAGTLAAITRTRF